MNTVYQYEFGNHGVALRHSPESDQQWLTHAFNSSAAVASGKFTKGFYSGHYFSNSDDALKDFLKRCKTLRNGVDLSDPERMKLFKALRHYHPGVKESYWKGGKE